MNRLTRTQRKWLLAAIKLLIVALVAWFVRGTILGAVAQVSQSPWSFAPGWLALSALFYVLGMLPEGLFWHRVLRSFGQDVRLGESLRAYYVGTLGKYVPGKAVVIVLRTGLIRPRVNTGLTVAGIFLSTLTMMAVGACIAIPVLGFWFAKDPRLLAAAIAVAAVSGLPTLPPVFCRLARLAGVGRSDPTVAEQLARLNYRTMLGGWPIMIVGWYLMGASLWAVLRAMGIAASLPIEIHHYTATLALAIVGGFVSMIPGGLGVREAVITVLLGRLVGSHETALVVAAVLRLVWIAGELLVAAVLYPLGSRRGVARASGACRE